MDVAVYSYPPGDPVLIDKIVNEFLSQGKFDKLRKECMADADTKPAYQNLQQRVESTVSQFLKKQTWKPDLNKNQLRDSLRKHILESGFLDAGINRIVDQIVNPNVLATVFMPEVEEVVYSYLSIPRPIDKSQRHFDPPVRTVSDIKAKQPFHEDIKLSDADFVKDESDTTKKYEEHQENGTSERIKTEETPEKNTSRLYDSISSTESTLEIHADIGKVVEDEVKPEVDEEMGDKDFMSGVQDGEFKEETVQEDGTDSNHKPCMEKMELPSDESQESLSRMGVERLHICESDGVNAPDSDASLPLEINEKSMSDSRDSDDSIMNKMSPISQGRLTPEDIPRVEEEKEEKNEKEKEKEKEEKEEKKPLTFIGRIPKLKRDDSESSKSSKKEETPKRERLYVKSVYSSDESDSSKHSFSKSDSDDRKSKEKKRESRKEESSRSGDKYDKAERKYKEEDRRRKKDHHKSSSGDGKSHSKDSKSRDDKSRSRRDEKDRNHCRSRDEKRDKSRDKNSSGDKKSSSSSSSSHSRSKSSSHHRSVHKSGIHDKEHHREGSKSRDKDRSRHDRKDKDKRDFDKRKKDEDRRKKSKNVDDHGRERNKRDDRRSTDRDSNERERDKSRETSSSRQSDGRKREKDHKSDESKREKTQREESDKKEDHGHSGESVPDTAKGFTPEETSTSQDEVTLRVGYVTEEILNGVENEIIVVNLGENEEVKGETCEATQKAVGPAAPSVGAIPEVKPPRAELAPLDIKMLYKAGALTKVEFPKVIDDFYVKFDSTGFRYFEDWETTKLDCEEEFKEYIDEAEKDLGLLSDDGSDYENADDHLRSETRKQEILRNSLIGIGNFDQCLIFDPITYEFYSWSSPKYYKKYKKKSSGVVKRRKNPNSKRAVEAIGLSGYQAEEDDVSRNKENRGRSKIQNSLKLLNRYHRKMGLKLKYGKEQHRFARRRKRYFGDRSVADDARGIRFKQGDLRVWNNGNSSEDDRCRFVGSVSEAFPTPDNLRVMQKLQSHKVVLKECQDTGENLIERDDLGMGYSEAVENGQGSSAESLAEEDASIGGNYANQPKNCEIGAKEIDGELVMVDPGVVTPTGFDETDTSSTLDDLNVTECSNGNNSTSSTVRLTPEEQPAPRMDVDAKIRLYQMQSLRRAKPNSYPSKGSVLGRSSVPGKGDWEYEEGNENVINADVAQSVNEIELKSLTEKTKNKCRRLGLPRPRPRMDDPQTKSVEVPKKASENYNLPLSPESDDSTFNNGVVPQRKDPKIQRKRMMDAYHSHVEIPSKKLKDCKRTFHQKYDSQDLYKPRPFSIGSKTRGRALPLEDNFTKIDNRQK